MLYRDSDANSGLFPYLWLEVDTRWVPANPHLGGFFFLPMGTYAWVGV